jgi:hypothetical protein
MENQHNQSSLKAYIAGQIRGHPSTAATAGATAGRRGHCEGRFQCSLSAHLQRVALVPDADRLRGAAAPVRGVQRANECKRLNLEDKTNQAANSVINYLKICIQH